MIPIWIIVVVPEMDPSTNHMCKIGASNLFVTLYSTFVLFVRSLPFPIFGFSFTTLTSFSDNDGLSLTVSGSGDSPPLTHSNTRAGARAWARQRLSKTSQTNCNVWVRELKSRAQNEDCEKERRPFWKIIVTKRSHGVERWRWIFVCSFFFGCLFWYKFTDIHFYSCNLNLNNTKAFYIFSTCIITAELVFILLCTMIYAWEKKKRDNESLLLFGCSERWEKITKQNLKAN